MSSPSQPLQIQAPFVGRKREQQAYRQLLSQTRPWVLIITGQGGNGKSTLLRYLAEQTPQDVPVVTLNFANASLRTDPLKILEELSWKLAAQCAAQDIDTFKKTLTEQRNKLSALSGQMSQTIHVAEAASLQGAQLSMSADSAALREQRRQVREMVTSAFYTQVLTFQPARLVLMLDTCEWLSEPEGVEVGQWVMDELIPGMHERLRQRRCQSSIVIASRMQPPLTVIEQQDCSALALPMLEKAAVEDYLSTLGMQDVALRQRVYDITYGHALCVSIIGTLWQEQGDHPLTLADLPGLQAQFSERVLLEFIQERLDKRLKTPFRELTRYGVLLRRFNLPMLRAVFPELFPDADALDRFYQLTRYPYIEPLGNQHYAFHDLLREIQAAEVREQQPEKWREYHKLALDYLTQVAPHSADWYYHAIAYEEEQGMSDWWDAIQTARNRGEREDCGALLQIAHDETLKLTPTSSAQCAFQQGRFHYNWTDMDTALESYEQALTLFRQVGDRLGEANVRQAMGDVQQFRDEREAALESYEQALTLFRQVGSKLGEANVLQAMGDVQQFRKDMQAALSSYEQALTLFRQVGSKLGEANCYLAQGRIALEQEDYQKALRLHYNAYQLYQQIQDRYSQAHLLYSRSFVYEAMNEQQRAIQDVEKALTIAQSLNIPEVDPLQERLDELRGDSS